MDNITKTAKTKASNPKLTVILLVPCFLLLLTISMSGRFGGLHGLTGAPYLSEDADMLGAEAAYAGMEADLQYLLNIYAVLNPGYDEYRFDLDEIKHDPYVLMSVISSYHEGAWTRDEAQGILVMLFKRQYTLTEKVTGDSVISVTLDNFNLSHLPIHLMNEVQLSRYAMFMSAHGNRPGLFPVSSFPNASVLVDYGRHDIPRAYINADPTFAEIIEEAEKYLGFPYVWGGYNPKTSFDCSGFVSWVYNRSGWDFGRLTAQGLYDVSAPVPASNAKPGDLIFFTGTYDTSKISHVGIYVGDGMMLHCGNPIGYASINTVYWQNNFYAFGRLN